MITRVNRKRLSEMKVGETRVFTEGNGVRNAGAAVTSYACRAGVKVTTHRCYIVRSE